MSPFRRVLFVKPRFRSALGLLVEEIPLGLEYLASNIRESVDAVRIVDLGLKNPSFPIILKDFSPDLVAFTVQMSWHNSFVKILNITKKYTPLIKTVAGGYYPTGFPQLLQLLPNLDYLIRGEGEQAFLDLVRGKSVETINNLSYRTPDGKVHHNPIRPCIQDLDILSFPARDLREHEYFHLQFLGRLYDVLSTSRGCYGHCTFCCEPIMSQSRQRFRTPQNVIQEIDKMWEFHNERPLKVTICDPNFMGIKKEEIARVDVLCDLVIERGYDIDFSCMTRADGIARNPQTVRKMIEAGIHTFEIGIESPLMDTLISTHKGTNLELNRKAIQTIRRYGGFPLGTMVLAFPGQSEKEIKTYPHYATALGLTETAFALATPLVGTPYFKEMVKEQRITTWDFSKYDYLHPVLRTGLSSKKQMRLLGYCYGAFYTPAKLTEGNQFYEKINPTGEKANTSFELAIFALKAIFRHSFSEQLSFLKGFFEGAIAARKRYTGENNES